MATLSPAETQSLLARLEPLPALDHAKAPAVRAPSPPPPRSGTVEPIAFVVPQGRPAADGPARPVAIVRTLVPPQISPSGEVAAESQIRIRFDEPMVAVAQVGEVAAPPATLAPPVPGTASFLAPIPGAAMSLVVDGKPAGTAANGDADGHAVLELLPHVDRKTPAPPAILVARAQADSTFVAIDTYNTYEKALRGNLALWYVTDDRFTYRPGEKVYVKGWVRWTHDGVISPSYIENVDVIVDRFAKRREQLDGSTLPLPEYAEARTTIAVDPSSARLEMQARSTAAIVQPGDQATFEVVVRRAGQPVANAEVALIVVDEAILALPGRSHADPLAPFSTPAPVAHRRILVPLRISVRVRRAAFVSKLPDGRLKIRLGARVLVQVEALATAKRDAVAVVDPLPAGLEAVNDRLATSERAVTTKPDTRWDYRNMRDNRSEAFAMRLGEGTHTFAYTARAATPGTFFAAPAKAEEMYSPETFGRSTSQVVVIE